MKIEKFKRRANVHFSTGGSLDVHFFLGYQAETHSGPEILVDVLNSDRTFVPVEDILMNEVLLIGKTRIVYLELPDAGAVLQGKDLKELPVTIELVNGETLRGSFLTDLPAESRRASDYLNLMPRYICLHSEPHWLVINKAYVLSVKQGQFSGCVVLEEAAEEKPAWVERLKREGKFEKAAAKAPALWYKVVYFAFGYAALACGVYQLVNGTINAGQVRLH